jgi:probable HAF family extracellular repeat protein
MEEDMSHKYLRCAATPILAACLLIGIVICNADGAGAHTARVPGGGQVRYKLIDIGTFGGPNSSVPEAFLEINGATGVQSISDNGTIVGAADTAATDSLCFFDDCFFPNGFASRNGVMTGLVPLPNSLWSAANAVSGNALITGASENGQTDPVVGLPEVRAAFWRGGMITDLGTLPGGYESASFAINNGGEVAGFATNTVADSFSFWGRQIRAVLWRNGAVQDLGTLGGPDAEAFFVNQRGDAAGFSFLNGTVNADNGPCQAYAPAQEPFFWRNGQMVDIGNFGGTCGISNALNNRGQVVGQSYTSGNVTARAFLWQRGVLSDLGTLGGENASAEWLNDAGDVVGYADLPGSCNGLACVHHGFLWKHGKMTDLGTLPSDPCSRALSINSSAQVVGGSATVCGGELTHALLWDRSARAIDLNTLIAPGSGLTLTYALYINDRGDIAGNGVLSNGNVNGFLLIPCGHGHGPDCQPVFLGRRIAQVSRRSLYMRGLDAQRRSLIGPR